MKRSLNLRSLGSAARGIVILSLCLCVQSRPLADIDKAQNLLRSGELSGAKKELQETIGKQPNSAEALVLLANVFLLEDDFENASLHIRRALKVAPNNPKALATHGHCLFREGDFEGAEAEFRKSLQVDAREPSAQLGLGRLFLTRLESTEALKWLQQAIQVAPELEDSYFFVSEAYGVHKDVPQQIQALEKYLALRPKFHQERVQNAEALVTFFKSFEKESVAQIKDHRRRYDLPFQPFFGLMLVEGQVNGQGPYRFLVDSGATSTVLSNALIDRLKITPISTAVVKCVGGTGKSATRLCKINKLQIGDLEISNLPVASFDNTVFAELIDGVLSTADLADFLISLDYPDKNIILSPRPPSEKGGSPRVTPESGTRGTFRVLGNLLLVPISINNQPARSFLFDTGAVTSTLSKRQAALLGVDENTADASVDIQFAGACGVTQSVLSVDRVSLGFQRMKQDYAKILAVELKEISKEIQTEVSGILGGDFYSKFKVTLDYETTSLVIE